MKKVFGTLIGLLLLIIIYITPLNIFADVVSCDFDNESESFLDAVDSERVQNEEVANEEAVSADTIFDSNQEEFVEIISDLSEIDETEIISEESTASDVFAESDSIDKPNHQNVDSDLQISEPNLQSDYQFSLVDSPELDIPEENAEQEELHENELQAIEVQESEIQETDALIEQTQPSIFDDNNTSDLFDSSLSLDADPDDLVLFEAVSGSCGDNVTWTLNDNLELTISGTGRMTDYTDKSTLPWGKNIQKVTIEAGIENIGNYAFYGCTNLKYAEIPSTVKTIGSCAFANCTKLSEIVLPEGMEDISYGVFIDCLSLLEITLPGSLVSINPMALSTNWNKTPILLNIFVDDSNPYLFDIDGVLFDKTTMELVRFPDGRTGTYVVPDGTTKIGSHAFIHCNINDVIIPEGVTGIGSYAFQETYNLSEVVLPNSLTTIDYQGFYGTRINSITVPANVTFIGDYAFADSKLNNIFFLGKPESIGYKAFGNVKADVYYNSQDGWNLSSLQDYGGTLNWIKDHVHTIVIDPAVAATCTESGLTEGSHCSVCDEVIKAQEEVPAKGHRYVNGVCAVCGDVDANTGWTIIDGKTYYYVDGQPLTNWQRINRKWYYFNEEGVMQTSWLKYGKNYFYLDPSNGALRTGWVNYNNDYYYLNPSTGVLQTGWVKYGKNYHYLDPSTGTVRTGWLEYKGNNYYLDPTTRALQTGWIKDGKNYYYLDPSTGVMQTGWVKYKNNYYYLDSKTGAMVTGTKMINGIIYKFNSRGICVAKED